MVVFCTYCGHQFTRDEHLERHILTHTNIKPFKCTTCHMSFARRDLLQRHYTVHGKNPENGECVSLMIPKTAGRTPIACTNCAKTKTKCDKKFPCSRCSSRNLKCILRPTRRTLKTQSRMSEKLEDGNLSSSSELNLSEPRQMRTPDQSEGNSPQPQNPERRDSIAPKDTEQRKTPEPKQVMGTSQTTFFETPRGPAHSIHSSISPLPTPGTIINGFIPASTPIPGYDEFTASTSRDESVTSSPLIMDWSQLHFSPPQLDQMRPDLMMAHSLGNTFAMTMDGIAETPMLSMLPEFGQSIGSMHSSLTTPRLSMSTTLSDLEMTSSNGTLSTHTSFSEPSTNDLSPVVKAQDGWNSFRSIPTLPPSQCPRTARLHLEQLEKCLKNHEGWRSWRLAVEDSDPNDYLAVTDLDEFSKDKLLAITQMFLHKAVETHRNSGVEVSDGRASPLSMGSNFILLPPIRVLKFFLRSYVNTFERFFPMTSRGTLNMNEQIMNPTSCDKAASLLTLMMIASGSLFVPSIDARWLNGGLTEACRISLFDLIETNISMASDQTVLHSALLFTATAAWGGDKWHMNIAMGQRGMYTAMLRHSGALEQLNIMLPAHAAPQELWCDWLAKEGRSRLVYSWAILDQELSFFHDTMPLFSVTEFHAPMPDSDRLWHAKSAAEWSTIFSQVHDFSGGYSSVGSGIRPISLKDLFRRFMEEDLIAQGVELTPLQLRLLFHPLQSLISQYRQYAACFSGNVSQSPDSPSLTNGRASSISIYAASAKARYHELQALLQKWQNLAIRYLNTHPVCPVMQASLTMFHLISLNATINFPTIERLARKENDPSPSMAMNSLPITDETEALFHAGQVLRLVRAMSPAVRPPWWAAAIYRVALVFWAVAVAKEANPSQYSHVGTTQQLLFAGIDSLPTDNALLAQWRSKGDLSGVRPVLNKPDGSHVPLDNCFAVLLHCVQVLDEGVANRFSDGIRSRLERLARG